MSDAVQKTDELSLWECLHDGTLDGAQSDPLARTMSFVIDVPFHWEFNNLDPSTRFRINLEEVLAAAALTFVPWPGRHTNLTAADYELIVEESSKGRLQSVEWEETFRKLESAGEFRITHASLDQMHSTPSSFRLKGSIDATGDYFELRIEANHGKFFIGDNELSPEDFLKFGERYWQAFATGTRPQDAQKESE